MEDVPPSYETATTRDYWAIIARYITSSDLCAASLVSRRWCEIFTPRLWGNPASHFGIENDAVYVALTRFKRTLKWARLSVRQLTHTIHLPPAQSELYDGPHPEWLREILESLPHLQTLIVSELPFFDHSSLLALRYFNDRPQPSLGNAFPTYRLRLLDASRCINTTSASLADALGHFPHLVYLDLSSTLGARDSSVLSTLRFIYDLQILKLRSLGLKDTDLVVLSTAIGTRVRSLDLRNNLLTDNSARTLLNFCFRGPMRIDQAGHRRRAASGADEDWPFGSSPRPPMDYLDELEGPDLDMCLIKRLTEGFVSRLPIEDVPEAGITHLYIANNQLTVQGLASLVKSTRLHVLDAGSVKIADVVGTPLATSSPTDFRDRYTALPGAEKLIPVLASYAYSRLTYLRIHHAVVTGNAPLKEATDSRAKLPSELGPGVFGYELDATEPVFELSAEGESRTELPGDCIHIAISAPPLGEKPHLTNEEQLQTGVRRASIFAPEVVEKSSPLLKPTEFGILNPMSMDGRSSHNTGDDPGSCADGTTSHADGLESTFSNVLARRQRLHSRTSGYHGLEPSMLPKLRTIVLTDVPCKYANRHLIDRLISFICHCAEEAEIANLQASVDEFPVQKDLGRESSHMPNRAHEIFALQHIILEMAPASAVSSALAHPLSPRTPPNSNGKPRFRSKSSTEDADSESFWLAAQNDFSFFGSEECGLPEAEPGLHFPMSSLNEKVVLPTEDMQEATLPILQPYMNYPHQHAVEFDVIAELSKFRKERKRAYEAARQDRNNMPMPRPNLSVNGYWAGEIKVIRHGPGDGSRHGSVDWYRNPFEKGYV
ncbi:MAG: hypothetical protein M1830_009609 [Pleopsidium flavum]|nr:MAG: hypothetical protein M1830_009609 [Pleopsidium flavum]